MRRLFFLQVPILSIYVSLFFIATVSAGNNLDKKIKLKPIQPINMSPALRNYKFPTYSNRVPSISNQYQFSNIPTNMNRLWGQQLHWIEHENRRILHNATRQTSDPYRSWVTQKMYSDFFRGSSLAVKAYFSIQSGGGFAVTTGLRNILNRNWAGVIKGIKGKGIYRYIPSQILSTVGNVLLEDLKNRPKIKIQPFLVNRKFIDPMTGGHGKTIGGGVITKTFYYNPHSLKNWLKSGSPVFYEGINKVNKRSTLNTNINWDFGRIKTIETRTSTSILSPGGAYSRNVRYSRNTIRHQIIPPPPGRTNVTNPGRTIRSYPMPKYTPPNLTMPNYLPPTKSHTPLPRSNPPQPRFNPPKPPSRW